jgi:hypothetical protein
MGRNKKGFFKMERKILDWEWLQDPKTVVTWIVLMAFAEWDTGCDLKPGQIITTQKELMEYTGLSRQELRTALSHLVSTKEITIEPTKDGTKTATLITIEKWRLYQMDKRQPTKTKTSAETDDSTFLPLYKKNKEIKEIKKGQTAPVEAVPMPPEMKAKLDTMFSWRKDN